MENRKTLFLFVCCMLILALCIGCTAKDTAGTVSDNRIFQKPVTIVTRQAGGGVDVVVRVVQPALTRALGQNVIVENVDGGAGAIAVQEIFKRNADGYTFGAAYVPTFIVFEVLQGHGWKTKDTMWVANLTRDYGCVLVASVNSPIKTWADIAAIGARRPVTIAGSGVNSVTDFQSYFLQKAFPEIAFSYVPFNSGGEAGTAMAGNHTDLGIAVLSNVTQMEKDGLVKFLAFFPDARLTEYPNTPTFEEFSGRRAQNVDAQIVLFAKNGTSDEAVRAMNEAVRSALGNQDVISQYAQLGNLAYPMTSEELRDWAYNYWDDITKIKADMEAGS
jgi:tripartite-type tricarboxylate transporter receptor subunit TctC